MEDRIIIDIQKVTKEYQLYNNHADRVKEVISPFRKKYHHTFSALNSISFTIKQGEFFGIIGRNGSGKSTLLQLICGILQPTFGTINVEGRIAALLELGAGFNPEFTGKQNVYLNGAILGFSEEEIAIRYKNIVEFADIGEFINQPVKTYSSGMYVRLAFAVQACVEPDVLIVDEALAVGDIFFRQKCYARLQSLLKNGCTVILVSHAMNDIEQFCDRALLLHKGEELFLGSASEAVKRYYLVEQKSRMAGAYIEDTLEKFSARDQSRKEGGEEFFWPCPEAFMDISNINQVSNGRATCTGVAVCNAEGSKCLSFEQGEIASFFYEFQVLQNIEVPIGGLEFMNDKGLIVHGKSTLELGNDVPMHILKGTKIGFRHDITLAVATGEYSFSVGLATIIETEYNNREHSSHLDLYDNIVRLCHLSNIGVFSVVMRKKWSNSQLSHHGIADLPGQGATYVL